MFDTKTSSSTKDSLIAGSFPLQRKPVTLLLDAAAYVRGTVLGIITASGKAVIVDSDAEDGSQNPVGVLLDDPSIDASAADRAATMAVTGAFNGDALIFGGTDVLADHAAALEALNIYTDESAEAIQ